MCIKNGCGLKPVFLISISIVLSVFTLPSLNISIAAWLALVPLFFFIYQANKIRFCLVVLIFFTYGLIINFIALHWIMAYQKKSFFLAWLVCTLIYPVFAAVTHVLLKKIKNIYLQALLIPSIWILLLKIYSFTNLGYHWGEQFLAYSQNNIYLLQIASLSGTMGINFLMLFFNASVALSIVHRNAKSIVILAFGSLLIFAVLIYGYNELNPKEEPQDDQRVESLKVAVVQPGASGEKGFEHVNPILSEAQFLTCMRRRSDLPQFVSMNREAQKENPDLIIWPQYNFPIDITRHSRALKKLYLDFNTPVLMGTFSYRGGKIANISLLLDHYGEVMDERISVRPPPFRQMNQTFGDDYKPIKFHAFDLYNEVKIGALLCYEDTSAEDAISMVDNGADFLVVHVNDEVFQDTKLPEMHLQRNIFRAIENRRWLVRSATTGISAVIDPFGRIVKDIKIKEKNIAFVRLKSNNEKTFYVRHRDLLFNFALGYLVMIILSIFAVYIKKCFKNRRILDSTSNSAGS